MSYCYQTRVRMYHVDHARVIFFPRLYYFCQEVVESYFFANRKEAGAVIFDNYVPVIVNAESNYFAPIRFGDKVDIVLYSSRIGNTSFTLTYEFFNKSLTKGESILVANARTIHVVTDGKGNKLSIPLDWIEILKKIFKEKDIKVK